MRNRTPLIGAILALAISISRASTPSCASSATARAARRTSPRGWSPKSRCA